MGLRKISRLIQAAPRRITVLDPVLKTENFPAPSEQTELILLKRRFEPGDLQDIFLVMACTGDTLCNANISALCQDKGILCNSVNQPEKSGFILPALHTAGNLQIAVSTAGKSPALAAYIKDQLAQEYGSEYGLWLEILGRIRTRLLELEQTPRENKQVLRSFLDQAILRSIRDNDRSGLEELLRSKLPAGLQTRLQEFTNGLF